MEKLSEESLRPHEKRLLNKREAAALLGVSTSTVRNWCARGIISCLRLTDRTTRFAADTLLEEINRIGKGDA